MSTKQKAREQATKVSTIKHFRQKHRLMLREEASERERCLVCGKHGDDILLGSLYSCTDGCDFVIHNSCSAIPPVLLCKPQQQQQPVLLSCKQKQQQEHHNHFHPQHRLFLERLGYTPCDACGHRNHKNRMAYKCSECSFIIHVTCSFFTPTTSSSSSKTIEAQDQDDHHHPHPLILCDPPPKIYTYNCIALQTPPPLSPLTYPLTLHLRPSFARLHENLLCWACNRKLGTCDTELGGFAYHCFDCKFYLGVACATSLQPTTTTTTTENNEEEDHDQDHRQFTHSHPLILCHNKQQFPIHCYACEQPLGDSVFLCPTCHILIHKSCAQMPREIKHPLHPRHPLTLATRFPYSKPCEGCFSYESQGFAYVCSHCKFNLDVRCAFSKPTTMMSKIRHHPLAFFNKPIHKLICNACHKPCHTPCLRCAWCKLNLHVHCIPTLPPNAVKSRFHRPPLTLIKSPIKDCPYEDDDTEFYCDDCEKRRELARPSYYCRECHYVAHPHCVASEIMRILGEEWLEQEGHRVASEAEEPPSLVLKDFLSSFIVDETNEAQGVFEHYRRDSQRYIAADPKKFQNLDQTTMQIMKMLVLKNKVTIMPWENWNSTSKLIKVNDYMILEKLAPILKALLEKYGYFIGNSGLSRKVKMLYIMTVCDAIHSMCNTKVLDVTANLLVCWFRYFMLGPFAGFEIEFAFDLLMKVVRAHFGLQANIIAVDPNFSGLFVDTAKQYDPPADAAIDSVEELTVIEQDGETNELIEKVVFMKLDKIKLDEEIRKLDKEIRELEKTTEEKRTLHRMWKEWFKKGCGSVGRGGTF
ncbi:unnamed protein product [Camellia sinensis]